MGNGHPFDHRQYVPILKWKQGEYQALMRLDDQVKDRLTPLLEIPSIGFDFETQEDRRSAGEHISDFGRRLRAKWEARTCFVDAKYLDPNVRLVGGRHFISEIFEQARVQGCPAIPVVSLSSDHAALDATAAVVHEDRNGACLRLTLPDFDLQDLSPAIERVFDHLGVGYHDMDLIVDAGAPNFEPITAFSRMMGACIQMISSLDAWRTFTFAGSSYPSTVAELQSPYDNVQRLEWLAYQRLVAILDTRTRIPTFGDYGVAHPEPVDLDMRLIRPFAKLRYTSNDFWHVGKGTNVREDGFDQYQGLCATLVDRPYFDGGAYSAGDQYIEQCAAGNESTGNLTTWVWVSTNRHLTKVVNDLAIFHGP